MRQGDRVTYVDTKGKHHPATVTAVSGTGASGFKELDIVYDTTTVQLVPHAKDKVSGKAYWLLANETEKPPERRADEKEQPIALAAAEATGALPVADRRAEEPPPPKSRRKAKTT